MSLTNLRQLDRRSIAIELTIQQQSRLLKGTGRFSEESGLGPALHVAVRDPQGDFELLLIEKEWQGQIDSGSRFDCDFALRLDAASLCTPSR